MSNILGIDHPLVAVRNLAACQDLYKSLGFQLSPQGQHPWGTATSLVLFKQQILELVGIGDASLLDGYAAGSFRFGRHVEAQLKEREGVALCALYSDNAEQTEVDLTSRKVACTGTIEFGRDVTRSDGVADRTSTTLKVFHNVKAPRLSVFACQQHRRDLLEFPALMEHPNAAHGIDALTVLCSKEDWSSTIDWLSRLHASKVVEVVEGEVTIQTGNGVWRVCDVASVERRFGSCDLNTVVNGGPTVVGIDVRTSSLALASRHVGIQYTDVDGALVVSDMARLGGVMLRFIEVC